MPNPTLYDNFNQVRQYIDQNQVDLSSYVSKSELEGMSYATTTYVADYVAEHGGGGSTVIDENIIPKETNTYTLGDSSHLYNTSYTNNIFMDGHSITYRNSTSILFSINNRDSFIMLNSSLCPSHAGINLGIDYPSNKWATTYTTNIYADNAYISNYNNFIWTGTSAEYEALSDYTTYQLYLVKDE